MPAKNFDPVATYRIQFHKGFDFTAFDKISGYLQKLGVKTIYASPIFEAIPGSNHGYDVVNPNSINPEIGSLEQLMNISGKLKAAGMSWLQDIVPNHMAFHPGNKWLKDVLEKGPASKYARYFDIRWNNASNPGKIILPYLTEPLSDAIINHSITLVYASQKLGLQYAGNILPVNSESYQYIIAGEEKNGSVPAKLKNAFKPGTNNYEKQLSRLMNEPEIAPFINDQIKNINNNTAMLETIIGQQHYKLTHWRETEKNINYRRFFTVNGLIGLNMQNKEVFENYHLLINKLSKDGIFQGLRVDHIDGLCDPMQYLYRLREIIGDEQYIVVEKVLQPGEDISQYWPIQGTTGYDFLAMVNNLLSNPAGETKLLSFYNRQINYKAAYEQLLHDKKKLILYRHMHGELDNLYTLFENLELGAAKTEGISPDAVKEAIADFLIQCPVYRYYGSQLPLDDEEAGAVKKILGKIKSHNESLSTGADVLEHVLLIRPLENDKEYNRKAASFYQSCMQMTAPLMAKGMEDTLMYIFNSFIAHNEVGDTPNSFYVEAKKFHKLMAERQEKWPLSLNASATHDTKRGEDTRARLNAITDFSEEWIENIRIWKRLNAANDHQLLDINDEYFIYMSLTGSYPLPGEDDHDFRNRFQTYIQKATREAKTHTTWELPNSVYENAVACFIDKLLDQKDPFWASFRSFQSLIIDAGLINSLVQVLLKFTCPGIPDLYQGCELWDFNMVDPDNRRPVNYEQREQWLEEITAKNPDIQDLWDERNNGKIKLWLTNKLLLERSAEQALFSKGRYIPIEVKGIYKSHILAFARQYCNKMYIIAVPVHIAVLAKKQEARITDIDWKDTSIVLPENLAAFQTDVLKHQQLKTGKTVKINDIFQQLPISLLKFELPENKRGAGILLPIFSLPSPFGTGDFGPEAKKFANFLFKSGQKYWQVLPLNPSELGCGHSPYCSPSSIACNTLFISPELMAEEGLLNADELKSYQTPLLDKIDYELSERVKNNLCDEAYHNFITRNFTGMNYQFQAFCRKHAYWLNDYALYSVLKNHFNGESWNRWPDKFKNREKQELARFELKHEDDINKVKWLQYIVARHQEQLKRYCNNLGIKLFGDLPFYVNYDSVDVWSHPKLFCLDETGTVMGMAGVPPDYFCAEGQLWRMPTYNWEELKKNNYDWWITRLRENLELFDLVRLDHFRAFVEYWQVPMGEETAINGEWHKGPGIEFFNTAKETLGSLPFVAEDLGVNMDEVYVLRKKTAMPGMKVIQFAWGENMPQSVDIPHNYPHNCVAYTGTHDTSTISGWYRYETEKKHRKRMKKYLGRTINKNNAHKILSRMLYASVADTVILPMQDILGCDEKARINSPGTLEGNWQWRLLPELITPKIKMRLKNLVQLFNR